MTIASSKLENRQLGGYKLISLLGRGGMAEVWRAEQLNLNRQVAVKVLSEVLVEDQDQSHLLERFRREAQAIARLDHPAVLPIIDYGQADGYLYMVTPLVPGGSLLKRLQNETLPRRLALNIFRQVLDGVAFAHHHNVIHRDLKPGNILLYSPERVVISDFGVAKIENENLALTTEGMVLGSPEYMAPEQFLGQAEYRSDLYSLGVILYQLLTGRVPYTGTSAWQIGLHHLNEPLPLPDPLIPPPLETFLARALQKRPVDRFKDADEMAQAFGQAATTLDDQALQVQPAKGQPSTPFSSKVVQNIITEPLPKKGQAASPDQKRPAKDAAARPAVPKMSKRPVALAVPAETGSTALPTLEANGNRVGPRPKTKFPVGLIVGTIVLLLAAAGLAVLFVVFATPSSGPAKQSPAVTTTAAHTTAPAAATTIASSQAAKPTTAPTPPAQPTQGSAPIISLPTVAPANPTPGTLSTTAPVGTSSAAQSSLSVTLNRANGTAARGTARLTDNGNGTLTVVVEMVGLSQGQHDAHIHQGSCASEGPLKYELEPLQTGEDGTASATSTVKTSLATLTTGNYYVDVANYTNEVWYAASCGDIRGG